MSVAFSVCRVFREPGHAPGPSSFPPAARNFKLNREPSIPQWTRTTLKSGPPRAAGGRQTGRAGESASVHCRTGSGQQPDSDHKGAFRAPGTLKPAGRNLKEGGSQLDTVTEVARFVFGGTGSFINPLYHAEKTRFGPKAAARPVSNSMELEVARTRAARPPATARRDSLRGTTAA